MFLPNLPCVIRKKGATDLYGVASIGPDLREQCAVVKLRYESVHTTLRADSGATRAHAGEFVINNRILLTKVTSAEIEDQLEVAGYKIHIKLLHPRYNVLGQLDHYEVEGAAWV